MNGPLTDQELDELLQDMRARYIAMHDAYFDFQADLDDIYRRAGHERRPGEREAPQ